MDMIEVDPTGDTTFCAAFDGRVLELFRGFVDSDSQRWRVGFFALVVSGPNKKGKRTVTVRGQSGSQATLFIDLDDAGWRAVQPLLDALKAAGVNVTD